MILGIDTNTYTDSVEPPTAREERPDFRSQHNFQFPNDMHCLHDALIEAARNDAGLRPKEAWWTYETGARQHRWDQVWISSELRAVRGHVQAEAPGAAPGKAHRPVALTVAASPSR